MLAEGSSVEGGTGSWQHNIESSAWHVRTGRRRFPQTGAVPGMAVQWPELADGTPVSPAVRNGGLTPADSTLCGGVVGIKCFCQSGG
jgi:hypothetical protein